MTASLDMFAARAPAILLAASASALGLAFAMQYWGGLAPCALCHYQRWPWALVAALAGAGLALPRARRLLVGISALALSAGAAVALYHAGVEQGWFAGPAACSAAATEAETIEELKRLLEAAPTARCNEVPWSLFGISLAGYNFAASTCLAAVGAWAAARMGRASA